MLHNKHKVSGIGGQIVLPGGSRVEPPARTKPKVIYLFSIAPVTTTTNMVS